MKLRKKIALLFSVGFVTAMVAIVEIAMSSGNLYGLRDTFGWHDAIGEQLDARHWNASLQEKQPRVRGRLVNTSREIVRVPYQSASFVVERYRPTSFANDKFVTHFIGNKLPTGNFRRRKKPDRAQPFRRLARERFPEYGSAEFTEKCAWTESNITQTAMCTILVKDEEDANGGISSWVSRVVHGFIHAKQAGCKLLLDYGQSVDIGKLLAPNSHLNNWTISPGFSCNIQDRCYHVHTHTMSPKAVIPFPFQIPDTDSASLASVPNYRWAYSGDSIGKLYRPMFRDLEKRLPGFQIETGLACSLGSLFHLAPTASHFEPRLFTKILPTLRDKDSLVVTLYIRTGLTDEVATKKEKGEAAPSKEQDHRRKAGQILDCALTLEARHLGDANVAASFSRVVWMVVTDSPGLKQWIADTYDVQDVNAPPGEGNRTISRKVPREIITTGSRGVHTRPRLKPSTNDFAEAVIDWYLIGESDALVAHSQLTFGFTGALRTNRPFYDADGCSPQFMVHEKVAG